MELQSIWQDYGLDKLEKGMQTLFPEYEISLSDLMERVISGDIIGALESLFRGSISGVLGQVSGMKNILIWLVVLGVVSALMTHFVEIFDRHQIADLSFYYIYLLMTAVLLKCFVQAAQTTVTAIENIVLFVKMLFPTYLLAIGVANGTTTAGAYSQLLILLIYGVEKVLVSLVVPLIYSFVILSVINSIWAEEKLVLLIGLMQKGVGWILKVSVGIVTGISIFQSVITPVVDSAKKTALQKAMSVVPGIGNAADGMVELVTGSALVIRNSIGVVLLILLLVLCAAPLLEIFLTALLLKEQQRLWGL